MESTLFYIQSTLPIDFLTSAKIDQLYSVFAPIFSDNMPGSCVGILAALPYWRQALDNEKAVAVVAIDLSKAFHSICHNVSVTSKTQSLRCSGFCC